MYARKLFYAVALSFLRAHIDMKAASEAFPKALDFYFRFTCDLTIGKQRPLLRGFAWPDKLKLEISEGLKFSGLRLFVRFVILASHLRIAAETTYLSRN